MRDDSCYFNEIVDKVMDVSESLICDYDFSCCVFKRKPLLYFLSDYFFKNAVMIFDSKTYECLGVIMPDKCIRTDLDLCTLLDLRVVHIYSGIFFVEWGDFENDR